MPPNKAKALMLAKRQLSELVCDAINLEGINYTLPEVQTLLDGITVGGHKLSEQQIVLNQSNAWQEVFTLVKNDQFTVTAEMVEKAEQIADVYDRAIFYFLRMAQSQFFMTSISVCIASG
ncbi:hypothetical protein KKHLCK_05545 [Candidatus Electrothrix laxa]